VTEVRENAARDQQARAFLEGEGDRWFERNRHALVEADWAADAPLRLVETHALQPASVFEMGAANGYRLAALRRRFGCVAMGVDASAAAVADGAQRFPAVRLAHASGDAVPFEHQFDLVVANFVLHWVDRALLTRTLAELDRLVVDGGHLVIGDFLPDQPSRRLYHHLPASGVYTYKQDYAAPFLATGCYEPVAMLTGSHTPASLGTAATGADRIATHLLRKRLSALYLEDAES